MKPPSIRVTAGIAVVMIASALASMPIKRVGAQGVSTSFVNRRVEVGAPIQGPPKAALVRDQSGAGSSPSRYISMRGVHRSVATYRAEGPVTTVTVSISARGMGTWTWSVYDYASASWVPLQPITLTKSWKGYILPNGAKGAWVSSDGIVRLQIRSTSKKARLDLDAEQLSAMVVPLPASTTTVQPSPAARNSVASTSTSRTGASAPINNPASATPEPLGTVGTVASPVVTSAASPVASNALPATTTIAAATTTPGVVVTPVEVTTTPAITPTTQTPTTQTPTTQTATTTTTIASATTATTIPPVTGGGGWRPTQSDRWLYQIADANPDLTVCEVPFSGGPCVRPTVWALDLYDASGSTPNKAAVDRVHAAGGRVVCYVSAGSWENWRPDAGSFPAAVLGNNLVGWPGEKWVDIRALTTLRPIYAARAQKCRDAGFDAIDWDNVDGYTNNTGFPVNAGHQLAFNRMLAEVTRGVGLAVGLKNDLNQVGQLVGDFDFHVNESCAQFDECALLLPFISAGKAVVEIEYTRPESEYCPYADANRIAAVKMSRDLTARPWKPCR